NACDRRSGCRVVSRTCDTNPLAMSHAGPCSRKRIAITRRSLATDCRETRRFPAFHRFAPAVGLPAPYPSRMVLTVRARVLILFALCIAGLAAIAAGFQHIPS
ncbi:hypothetical protein SB861_56865, partial [Paraburkholderia sp. SIMBA_049]